MIGAMTEMPQLTQHFASAHFRHGGLALGAQASSRHSKQRPRDAGPPKWKRAAAPLADGPSPQEADAIRGRPIIAKNIAWRAEVALVALLAGGCSRREARRRLASNSALVNKASASAEITQRISQRIATGWPSSGDQGRPS